MEQIICLVMGYISDLFQTGFIYDKPKGVDIHQYGSGNSGSINTLHIMGVKVGLIIFIGNFLKTMIPYFLVGVFFRPQPEYIHVLILCVGFGVILGHSFPSYLKFKGGKRIAVTAEIIFSLDWRLTAACLLAFVLIVTVARYMSLGSLVVSAIFLRWSIYLGHLGVHGFVSRIRSQFYAVSAVIVAMAFWRHRTGIVRLAQGRENEIGVKKKTEQYAKDNKRQLIDGEIIASIGVIGSGTWGAALSALLNGNGHMVQIWSVISQETAELKDTRIHHNLPEIGIPEAIGLTDDLEEAMRGKDLLVLAVSSVFVRQTLQRMRPCTKQGQVMTNVAKGIEGKSLMTLPWVIEEELPEAEVTVLSGPSHAEKVSKRLPTTCVTGARKRSVTESVQGIFMSEVFRVYISPDVLGIESEEALKNAIALAAGVTDGLGYGNNTRVVLITGRIVEISHLGINTGGWVKTPAGLTNIGDLIVTRASMYSRNRRAGMPIDQSRTMEEAMAEVKMVMGGTYSARAALALPQQYEVSMPIMEQVNATLFGGMPAKEAVLELILRDKRIENSDLEWAEE